MEDIFKLIESYGITIVLLVGSFYDLYKFFFFSIREVKSTFEKRHDLMREKMDEVKDEVNDLKNKIEVLINLFKK